MPRLAVVTGTTSGVGDRLAQRLAKDGWSLVLLNRSPERACAQMGDLAVAVTASIGADLADHKSLQRAADEISNRFPAIDLLVNNAGVQLGPRRLSPQGVEMHFEVNVLAPYQLVRRLAEPLATGRGIVLTVGSRSMFHTRGLDIAKLVDPEDNRPLFGPYTQSKFAVAVVMSALADEYKARGISFRTCCPGPTKTPATRGEGMPRFLLPVRAIAFQAPEKAAGKLVDALDSRFGSEPDLYIQGGQVRRLPEAAYEPKTRARLLDLCRELTGI